MSIKEIFTNVVQIPPELVDRIPYIELCGNKQLYIENYKSIIEYTEDFIKLRLKTSMLSIEGKNLVIEKYSKEELYITGRFQNIKFL